MKRVVQATVFIDIYQKMLKHVFDNREHPVLRTSVGDQLQVRVWERARLVRVLEKKK